MEFDIFDAASKAISGEKDFLENIEEQAKERTRAIMSPFIALEIFENILLSFLTYKKIININEYAKFKEQIEGNITKQIEEKYDKLIEEQVKKDMEELNDK